jgi:hypothetical protein
MNIDTLNTKSSAFHSNATETGIYDSSAYVLWNLGAYGPRFGRNRAPGEHYYLWNDNFTLNTIRAPIRGQALADAYPRGTFFVHSRSRPDGFLL